jgi:hypothetical protein
VNRTSVVPLSLSTADQRSCAPSAVEAMASKFSNTFHLCGFRGRTIGEHRNLERRPVNSVLCHLLARNWLHHVVDVHWHTASVRPEAVVDLVSIDQVARYGRCPLKQRAEFLRFGLGELSDSCHVALRFDYQGAESKRADAMLNQPVVGSANQPAW